MLTQILKKLARRKRALLNRFKT